MNIDEIIDNIDAASAKANDTVTSRAGGIWAVSNMNLDIPLATINVDNTLIERLSKETLSVDDISLQFSLPQIGDMKVEVLFTDFDAQVDSAVEKWTEYRWIPFLPNDSAAFISKAMLPPDTKEEADRLMLDKLDDANLQSLFNEIEKLIPEYNLNVQNWNEARKCFNMGCYTACSLLLYSLIDSIFIKGQPQTNSLKLAEKAVGLLNKDDKVKHFVTAKATINVVQELYKSASNFSISDHNNRNMMSHGMNIDNPDKTDTIKLFVLLFNILVLFKHNIFVWKQRNSNDEKA